MSRPIGYQATAIVLAEMEHWLHAGQLWHQVFGSAPPRVGRSRLELRLARRIETELFPIRIPTWVGGYVNWSLLTSDIPFHSIGVCWRRECWVTLPREVQPVVVALAPALGMTLAQEGALYVWCRRRPYARRLRWETCLLRFDGRMEAVVEHLKRETARLEGPLRGLAVAIAVVAGSTGNPFLDEPPGYARQLYGAHTYPWTADTIRYLAGQYRACRADLERYEEYRNWFTRWRGAAKKVYLTLMNLIEGG